MKKVKLLSIVAALIVTISSFLPLGKASAASTGYQTYNGITANVYTDRTGDYPVSDDWIDVWGQKTSTGGTVYYMVHMDKFNGSSWSQVATQSGSFASQTPAKRFYINDLLSAGSSGTFRVRFKIFRDSGYQDWIGDWITPSFRVYN